MVAVKGTFWTPTVAVPRASPRPIRLDSGQLFSFSCWSLQRPATARALKVKPDQLGLGPAELLGGEEAK